MKRRNFLKNMLAAAVVSFELITPPMRKLAAELAPVAPAVYETSGMTLNGCAGWIQPGHRVLFTPKGTEDGDPRMMIVTKRTDDWETEKTILEVRDPDYETTADNVDLVTDEDSARRVLGWDDPSFYN